jgi:hypothetical protein
MLLRLIAILFLISLNIAYGQSKCPDVNVYKTEKVSDTLDMASGLRMPLNFIIKEDSIIVSADASGKYELMALKILSRECFWNADFSEGKSVYNLLLGSDKGLPPQYPKMIIQRKKDEMGFVELLYENSEPRVFYPLKE